MEGGERKATTVSLFILPGALEELTTIIFNYVLLCGAFHIVLKIPIKEFSSPLCNISMHFEEIICEK